MTNFDDVSDKPAMNAAARNVAPSAFAVTMFGSAALIFAVQPMFAKMALPLLGGAPGVWNVALVFFQAALLVGYAYAHLLQRIRRIDVQLAIHAALIALSALALPLAVTDALGPPPESSPTSWLLGVLALSVGAPFAILSATAPLMQAWFARTGREDAADPYYLYAASNAGSMLALLGYPLLVEPILGASGQSSAWSFGFGVVAVAILACGLVARTASEGVKEAAHLTASEPLTWRARAIWVGLAAIPSSLLVGATSHITTDVAATPFLWAAPLALYLLTFIFAFAKTPVIPRAMAVSLHIVCVLALAVLFKSLRAEWGLALALNLGALFFAALVCHSALAARRPEPAHLTEFYLWLSFGGVIGGAFNALAAPVLFDSVIEYPLVLALSLLATVRADTRASLVRTLIILAAVAAPILLFAVLHALDRPLPNGLKLAVMGLAALAALSLKGRPVGLAAGAGLIFIAAHTANPTRVEFQDRGFFGVVRVTHPENYPQRLFFHGTTLHGAQNISGPERLRPATYYAPETPIGQAFALYAATGQMRHVGAVGLGVGSVACYRTQGQSWKFYEIDPLVVEVAKDPRYFTFLRDCAPDDPVIVGDARLTLAKEPNRWFDFILLDAFSSDVVPAHLMTREALRMYMDKLSDHGVLVFHISNKHLDLASTLKRVGAAEGLAMRHQVWSPEGLATVRAAASDVMVLAKSEAALKPFDADPRWKRAVAPPGRAWSDDYTNVLGALWEKRANTAQSAPPS